MISLRRLLCESDASEKAKRMGLEAAPFGKWKKNGVVTHMTDPDTGDLKPVDKKDQAANVDGGKPTTMSAKDAGVAPSNVPGKKDAEQKAGISADDGAESDSDGETDGMPTKITPQPHNPYTPKDFHPALEFGRPSDKVEARELFKADRDKLYEEMVPGEQVMILEDNAKMNALFNVDQMSNTQLNLINKSNAESSGAQYDAFRKKLPTDKYFDLLKLQDKWQGYVNRYTSEPDDERDYTNSFLNELSDKYKPLVQTENPIERGMRIPGNKLKSFLQALVVGKEMHLPVSGFSGNPGIARSFAQPSIGTAAVVMRIHPNKKGQVHGIHLTGVPTHTDRKNMTTAQQGIAELYDAQVGDYMHEREIIRTSGAKARCINVTKVMSKDAYGCLCAYIIDFEELGYDDAITEGMTDNIKYHTFEKYMNTPLRPQPTSMTEGKASDLAHTLKLTSVGGAYWIDGSGNIVAKTVDDNLVKYDNDAGKFEEPSPQEVPSQSLEIDSKVVMGEQLSTNAQSGGTNPGGVFKGTDGVLRYVKLYKDSNMAECEALADKLYADLGIPAAKGSTFEHNGKIAFCSEMVSDVKGEVAEIWDDDAMRAHIVGKILKGFVADCFLANWDVLGVNEGFMRNMVVTNEGEVVRIDNGSSLLHRGLNGRKKSLIGDKLYALEELDFFVHNNPSYKQVFQQAGINDYRQLGQHFIQQALKLAEVHDAAGGWDNYVDMHTPNMAEPDKSEVKKMLNARYNLLDQIVVDMQNSGV